jgi:23S rRNA (uracil1939-C5)-methyltransferase
METKTIRIEKLVHGGLGLSRTADGVVFVEGVMPGETIEAVWDSSSRVRGTRIASCHAIVEPSPQRRQPVCPLFGPNGCGGCDWMHMAYDAQLSIKEGIFRETLVRIGRIHDIPDPFVFASPELGYRRRVQFKVSMEKKRIGFFRRKSHDIAGLSQCPLLNQALNGLLREAPSHFDKLDPATRELKAVSGDEAACVGDTLRLQAMTSSPVIPGVTGPYTAVCCGQYVFPVSGKGFFQGNMFLAPTLGKLAEQWCCGETFLDLYGGSGFFSTFVASRFSKGICVDNEEDHIETARETFSRNGISSVIAEKSLARDFLERCRLQKLSVDCCIVDPPRTGLDDGVAAALARLGPRRILYVSCDPATQARDAGFLINQYGYRCEKAALLDFYPQTHHLETVLLLSRTS